MTGRITDENDDDIARITVETDEHGLVTGVIYSTELDIDMEDTGTLRAWALFSTEPEDEFDEYTDTSISIYLQAREY